MIPEPDIWRSALAMIKRYQFRAMLDLPSSSRAGV
jgi:hypothetical protein